MSAKVTGNITSLLYGLYMNATENTLVSLGVEKKKLQQIFLSDARWSGSRRKEIDEIVKQIKKVIEK